MTSMGLLDFLVRVRVNVRAIHDERLPLLCDSCSTPIPINDGYMSLTVLFVLGEPWGLLCYTCYLRFRGKLPTLNYHEKLVYILDELSEPFYSDSRYVPRTRG